MSTKYRMYAPGTLDQDESTSLPALRARRSPNSRWANARIVEVDIVPAKRPVVQNGETTFEDVVVEIIKAEVP